MNWYFKVLGNYAVFSGRARRKEFWYFVLFNFILTVLLSLLDAAMHPELLTNPAAEREFFGLSSIYVLATFLPSVAVAVRRFHDTGRTGWWVLFPLALAVLCVFASFFIGRGAAYLLFHALSFPIVIYFFILWVLDSDPGPNKYGPNPK